MRPSVRVVAWLLLAGACLPAVGPRRFIRGSGTVIQGRVIADGMPVEGALVRFPACLEHAYSDARGAFTLRGSGVRDGARVAVSKAGYFIAGAGTGESPLAIELRRHPRDDNPDYAWVDPRPDASDAGRCANCHREIFDEWAASSHAAAATNRRFLNVYDGTDWEGNHNVGWNLLEEFPTGAGVCYSCHFPSQPPSIEVTSDLRQAAGVHRQGIHCDFCHKIADVSIDNVGLNHGRFAIAFIRPRDDRQIFFGPLDDVVRDEDVHLPLYRQSRYCASCHEGTLFGTHVYGTYSEWLDSPQAKQGLQCQDCHMVPTGRMTNFAPGHGGIDRDPSILASHRFPGGDAGFLRDHLSLSLATHVTNPYLEIEVVVRVQGIGHLAPTGSPTRALILHVEAMADDGTSLALAGGPILPALAGDGPVASGGLAGRPGKLFAKVLEGEDGDAGVPFWRGSRTAYDTRLRPDEINRTHFDFGPHRGKSRVTARLIYRRFPKRVADEKGWPQNDLLIESTTREMNGG